MAEEPSLIGTDFDDEIHGPRPTVDEVLACQLSSWYPTFSNILPLNASDRENHQCDSTQQQRQNKLRKNVTIPSVIINDLPMPEFKNFLLTDGVKLPRGATKLSSCAGVSSKSDDYENGDNEDDENDVEFHFPDLNDRIIETVRERFSSAGAVMPKLNWSAPRDATWINEGTMKCKTPGDVYLLLKSSDFCTHDVLYQSLQDCQDYRTKVEDYDGDSLSPVHPPLQLILRKWCNLNPSMEFRCFVRRHELLGISQRQHSVHFPHLKQDKDQIYDLIYDFFEDYVKHRFADGKIGNYVLDVFLDKKDRIWVIDFNPWARTTDSLLYEWSELMSMDDEPEDNDDEGIRIAASEGEVRHDPLSSYRAPIDTVDLASMTHGDAKQFEEFMKLCQRPTYWEENSDEDEED
ncbi:unnamed protein product [Pseudo-nitzschia multistriata]|uniref:Cell division cycle protein 123 n=1 Tax=Pseudo-nitzschia multistriata TaxID=183589 RepID=A0A448ZR66_9STRA|nr:unnamed protein product [Pseudo-nitzschia multistriata]